MSTDSSFVALNDQYDATIRDLTSRAMHALRLHSASRDQFEEACSGFVDELGSYDHEIARILLRKLIVKYAGSLLLIEALDGSADTDSSCQPLQATWPPVI